MTFSLPEHFLGDLVTFLVFGLAGIAIVVVAYHVFDWLTPKIHIDKEIAENKNIAVAIIMGSVILGICYLVATVAAHIIG